MFNAASVFLCPYYSHNLALTAEAPGTVPLTSIFQFHPPTSYTSLNMMRQLLQLLYLIDLNPASSKDSSYPHNAGLLLSGKVA